MVHTTLRYPIISSLLPSHSTLLMSQLEKLTDIPKPQFCTHSWHNFFIYLFTEQCFLNLMLLCSMAETQGAEPAKQEIQHTTLVV